MNKHMIGDLRQLAAIKAGEITPRHTRLLSEAANHIEMLIDLLHERERDSDKWRKRALEAESKIKLRGMVQKG